MKFSLELWDELDLVHANFNSKHAKLKEILFIVSQKYELEKENAAQLREMIQNIPDVCDYECSPN